MRGNSQLLPPRSGGGGQGGGQGGGGGGSDGERSARSGVERPPTAGSSPRDVAALQASAASLQGILASSAPHPASSLPQPKATPVSPLHALVCDLLDAMNDDKTPCEKKPPPEFFCPISLMAMRDPIVAADGHFYERAFFLGVVARAESEGDGLLSPMTRESLGQGQIFKCVPMITMMEQWARNQLDADELGAGVSMEKMIKDILKANSKRSSEEWKVSEEWRL